MSKCLHCRILELAGAHRLMYPNQSPSSLVHDMVEALLDFSLAMKLSGYELDGVQILEFDAWLRQNAPTSGSLQ